MISGTIANKHRMERERAEKLRRVKSSVEKNHALEENRDKIISEVCSLFGWKELDPFAAEMIDKTISGRIVDIEQLKSDIDAWKKTQTEGKTANADTPTE